MANGNGTTPLRFAALTRVSTERQQKEGESLRTQKTAIENIVRELGGKVSAWYGGQEHATEDWEKNEIARLLEDARKPNRRWDAVIVTHMDRWSRDNESNHSGLKVFREHDVRLFSGSQEYFLKKPTDKFSLAIFAAVGSFQADQQKEKSILSRIHRARRGIPTCGKLPFGRTFDKETGQWGLDEVKQRLIEGVARRYLAGESMAVLAAEKDMAHSALHKILVKHSGDKWVTHFNVESLNVSESVDVWMPPLLPEATIRAILNRVAANKTYTHGKCGKWKNEYLLGRMVLCEKCGCALAGQTNRYGKRYYRHIFTTKVRCPVIRGYVNADLLENSVIAQLFETFGNPAAVERAFANAIPDLDAHRQHEARLAELDAMIEKGTEGRQRVLRALDRGSVSEDEAAKLFEESKSRIAALQQERDRLSNQMGHAPTADEVKEIAKDIASKFKRVPKAFARAIAAKGVANSDISRMTWAEKRDLLARIFAGKTPDGQRAGVYVQWPNRMADKTRRFTIKGLITESGVVDAQKAERKDAPDGGGLRGRMR